MTNVNPYKPPVGTNSEVNLPRVAYVWNFIIGVAVALLSVVACYAIQHFFGRAFSSDYPNWIATEMFLIDVSRSLGPLTGLCLFLLSISTFAFHERRRRWQGIYGIVVVILAFDFYSMTFTSTATVRAFFFAVSFSPVILFGSGWPRMISQSFAFLRTKT